MIKKLSNYCYFAYIIDNFQSFCQFVYVFYTNPHF